MKLTIKHLVMMMGLSFVPASGTLLADNAAKGGGSPLVLRTTNGNIVIRKLGTAERT